MKIDKFVRKSRRSSKLKIMGSRRKNYRRRSKGRSRKILVCKKQKNQIQIIMMNNKITKK